MLKASEAREIIKRTLEEQAARLTARATKKCEALSEEILKRAELCLSELTTSVGDSIRDYVITELQNNGYVVAFHPADSTITIQW